MRSLIMVALVACLLRSCHGAELKLVTDHTLSGEKVQQGRAMIMTLTTDNSTGLLTVEFTAPIYGSDDNNRVHLFLADNNHRITELKITPSASTVLMYWAPFNLGRTIASDESDSFEASSTTNAASRTWTGRAQVHRDLLPNRITLVNAANVHPADDNDGPLQYDNLYSITNYGIAIPDLMVLPRYTAVGARFLFDNDEGYSKEWKRND